MFTHINSKRHGYHLGLRRIFTIIFLLSHAFCCDLISQNLAEDHRINYCKLLNAAENYGRLTIIYDEKLPPNEVKFFNDQMNLAYLGLSSIPKINENEFLIQKLFSIDRRSSFPSIQGYHSSHTDPYIVFHMVKEVYRIEHFDPTCETCIQKSIDTINVLVRPTKLWEDYIVLYRAKGTIDVPLNETEILNFKTFLRCYYYDDHIHPVTPRMHKMGPLLIGKSDTTIVECSRDIKIEEPAILNNCNMGVTTKSYLEDHGLIVKLGTPNCNSTLYEIVFTAQSPCGKDTLRKYFQIKNEGPVITCPPDREVPCLQDIQPELPFVKTSCDLPYTISSDGPTLVTGQDKCHDALYQIVYTVTDECGRSKKCVQSFTIKMDDGLSIICEPDMAVKCKKDIDPGSPLTQSICELDIIVSSSNPTLISGKEDCPGAIYQIVYVAKDECNNEATCTRKFTIQNDGPVVECPNDQIVACQEDIKPENPKVQTSCNQKVDISTGPIILESGVDNCDGAVYSITYTIIEICGRKEECIQKFTLNNDPPLMLCPDDITVECIEDHEDEELEVETSCNVDSDDISTDPRLISGINNCPGAVYEIEHAAMDVCGRGIACVQYVRIANNPPSITCPSDQIVTSKDEIIPGSPDIMTSCGLDHELKVSEPQLESGDPDCPGAVYSLTYTVRDVCDRIAECEQLWTIMGQEIIFDCPPDMIVKCKDDIYPHISNGYTSWLFGNSLEYTSTDPRPIDDDEDCPDNVYEVIHTYKMHCDSVFECIQRFTIKNDGPKIICPPDQIINSLSDSYDKKPQISVDCNLSYDLDISAPELISGNYNEAGSEYYVTYKVEDACDREAECKQKLTLIGKPPGRTNPCDCITKWTGVSKDLIENREDRFNQDVAKLLKLKSCANLKSMILGGISTIYSEWASAAILESEFALTNGIRSRGPLDLVLKNLGEVDKQIKNIEALLYGDAKEIKNLIAPQMLTGLANSLGKGSNPALVITAINELGKFAEYLNNEILISNLKTLAEIAKREPGILDVYQFMNNYVKVDELKETQATQDVTSFRYRNMINEYVTFRLSNSSNPIQPLDIREVWKSQTNLTTYYAHAESMLIEICQIYCHRIKIHEQLKRLKIEQSMLKRFFEVYKYFKDYDCQGELRPHCDEADATLVQKSDGTYECQCTGQTKWDPNNKKCVLFEICDASTNTDEVFRNGKYECDCIKSGHEWDPDRIRCVIYPSCSDPNMNVEWNFNSNKYECKCGPGYKLDPSNSYCAEVKDCSSIPNSIVRWEPSDKSYKCTCESGYDWDPSFSFCASVENCSSKPNTSSIWNPTTLTYTCKCQNGFALDPTRTFCVPQPSCTVSNAELVYNNSALAYECQCLPGFSKDINGHCIQDLPDCSFLAFSEPVWNPSFSVYECQCISGYELDVTNNCVKKAPDCNAQLANSEPVWNPSVNDFECHCIMGYYYDPTSGNCEIEKPDCASYYFNTEPVWSSFDNNYVCDCFIGYVWNAARTGCIDAYDAAQANCYFANASVRFDAGRNEYTCECDRGYKWNNSKTSCIQKTSAAETIGTISSIIDAINSGLGGVSGGGSLDNPVVQPENQHQGQCSVKYGSGSNAPEQYTFDMGFSFGSISFKYQTFEVEDRIHVYSGGGKIFDTGCIGTGGWAETQLNLSGGQVRVIVNPLCDPNDPQTRWEFILGCPN